MTNTVASDAVAVLGDPSERTNPRVWEWVKESKVLAVGWLAMRVWLGVMWIQAGWAKLWGAENAAFLHHNGAGVAGFAGHAKPAYTWWGSFLHSFVVPNSGWIGVLVAVSELVIGFALVAGLFTRVAALGSLALLFTYVMSGTASVCAFYALFAIVRRVNDGKLAIAISHPVACAAGRQVVQRNSERHEKNGEAQARGSPHHSALRRGSDQVRGGYRPLADHSAAHQ